MVWEKTGSKEAYHEIGEGAHLGRPASINVNILTYD